MSDELREAVLDELWPWLLHKMDCARTDGYGVIDGVRLTPQKPCDCGLDMALAALAARPDSPTLDVERLARALHAFYAGKDTRYEFFPPECQHREDARFIAAAYANPDDPNDAMARLYAAEAPERPAPDLPSEYGRLLAERDRLIAAGHDPADLELPERPA